MIVLDSYPIWPFIRPTKDDPPLIVDSYRVQSGQVAFQGFEPIARWHFQVFQSSGPIHLDQFPQSHAGNRIEATISLFKEKLLGVFFGKRLDHGLTTNGRLDKKPQPNFGSSD